MGKNSTSVSAPAADPNIGLAQKKMAELAQKEYDQWSTEIWPALKAQTEKQEARSDEQFAMDKEMQSIQKESALKSLAEYDRSAVNREAIYKQAEEYDTEANKERLTAEAIGDTKQAFAIQAQDQERRMQSFGINPTSGQFRGMRNANNVLQAATEASAATRARNAAEQLGWAKKMDAAGLAQGSFGNQATSTGLALNAGNQALQSGQVPIQNSGALSNSMSSGYGTAMQGWNSVGQLGVQKYQADISKYNAENQANAANSAGWGSLAGAAIGAVGSYYTGGAAAAIKAGSGSDIRTKENIEVVGQLPNGLVVYEFDYKPEFKDRKYFGHGRFRGVMAHEVEAVNPKAVFETEDGYKVVDYSKVN